MKRVLALDVGTKTIGIAVSDPGARFAQPLLTLSRKGVAKDTLVLARVIEEQQAAVVVVGLPFELDGSEQRSARLARQIGEAVAEACAVTVVYVDERYSSVEAERRLIEMNVSRSKRKQIIDQVAAMIILETYVEEQG